MPDAFSGATVLGHTLPGTGFPRRLRHRSSLLFHWRAADGFQGHDPLEFMLKPLTGQVPTFARTSVGGRTPGSLGRLAEWARGIPQLAMHDDDADAYLEVPGLVLEEQRDNLADPSENFGSWTDIGTPIKTSGFKDPAGGTAAYKLEDNDGAAAEGVLLAVTFTGNAKKVVSVRLKAGTAGVTNLVLHDLTAVTDRHDVKVTWTAGVPALSTDGGAGDLYPVVTLEDGYYEISFSVAGVIAANTNQIKLFPAGTTVANTGTVFAYGVQAEDAVYPSTYITRSGASTTKNASSLTYATAFALPGELTAYARLLRPTHADATGDIGDSAGIFDMGDNTAAYLRAFFLDTARTLRAAYAGGSEVTADVAVPSGTELEIFVQVRNADTGGEVRISAGGAFSSWSSISNAGATAWGAAVLRIGQINAAGFTRLGGALRELKLAPGNLAVDLMQEVF